MSQAQVRTPLRRSDGRFLGKNTLPEKTSQVIQFPQDREVVFVLPCPVGRNTAYVKQNEHGLAPFAHVIHSIRDAHTIARHVMDGGKELDVGGVKGKALHAFQWSGSLMLYEVCVVGKHTILAVEFHSFTNFPPMTRVKEVEVEELCTLFECEKKIEHIKNFFKQRSQ